MSKTCGECRYFLRTNNYDMCAMYAAFREESDCRLCEYFTQKVITNGDKIIAGGNKELVKFHLLGTCDTCFYYNKEHTSHNDICLCPKDKTCADGIEAWLNAPAESEGENV